MREAIQLRRAESMECVEFVGRFVAAQTNIDQIGHQRNEKQRIRCEYKFLRSFSFPHPNVVKHFSKCFDYVTLISISIVIV